MKKQIKVNKLIRSEKHPLVSVIVVNYNDKVFIKKCLSSVLNTNYPRFEVIFVDNASTDGSLFLVKKLFENDKRLKIVCNNRNLGFAEGNNIGIKKAKGDYIVFLNCDTEVNPNWLIELIREMESDPLVGAAQSKLLRLQNQKRIDSYVDSAGGFIDFYAFSINRHGKNRVEFEKVMEIFYAAGAAMAIKRTVLTKVGFFDPEFFFSGEDVDLCWRVYLSGYKVILVPSSLVYHASSGGRAHTSETLLFHGCKNHIMLLLKNYETRNLEKYFIPYLVLVCSFIFYFSLKRDCKKSIAYIKAIVWSLLNFGYIWRARLRVQYLVRKLPDQELFPRFYPASIHRYLKRTLI